MTGVLQGLRVVDLSTQMAGVRATGYLADYGADVAWVEPLGGDPWRAERAVEYSVFNRGKRSVELDVATARDELFDLLAPADVLIGTWAPGEAERLGLDHATLHERFPRLVQCTITGFGTDGPHRDVPAREALAHALIGSMGEQVGHRDGPIYEGLPFASMGAAHIAVMGALAALYGRTRDGRGRHVETSLYDGALVYLAMLWGDSDAAGVETSHTEKTFMPAGTSRLITGSFLCGDGEWIGVHTGAVGAFGRLMKLLGLDDRIPSDTSGRDMGIPLTPEQQTLLHGSIHDIFASQPRDHWEKAMVEEDICGIPLLRPTECFDQAQPQFNKMTLAVDDPVLGRVEQVAPPARFSTDPLPQGRPAPRPGEHTQEVLAEARALGDRPDRPWVGTGPPDDGPLLRDVKVLDLGAMYAGPCASRHLADLGADVIKCEPVQGDPFRGLVRPFRICQSGKRSLAVNLKADSLEPARRRLLDWADIVHHNMRPGAAERMGVSAEDARAENPDVIYGHAAGWGTDGPYARRQSFEPMLSGYVGVEFEVAGQFNPPLYPLGNADPGNALIGAKSMLMSLLHRDRTGEGLYFENLQLNATMTHTAHIVRTEDGTVLGAERLDPLQFGFGALDRLYETSDGWLCLVAEEPDEIDALTEVTGVAISSVDRFSTVAARREHDYELATALGDVFLTQSTAEWLKLLADAGVPAAEPLPFNNEAFMRDPENRRTRRVAELPHPTEGRIREPDQYLRVSDATLPPHRLAPGLGEHTAEILEQLGYTREQIAELDAAGDAKVGG